MCCRFHGEQDEVALVVRQYDRVLLCSALKGAHGLMVQPRELATGGEASRRWRVLVRVVLMLSSAWPRGDGGL